MAHPAVPEADRLRFNAIESIALVDFAVKAESIKPKTRDGLPTITEQVVALFEPDGTLRPRQR
jgi:hypothetical protein